VETITKPIMFFIFICCIIFFFNIVLLFISYNKLDVFLNKSSSIIEKNGKNIPKSRFEIDEVIGTNNEGLTYEIIENDANEFRDSVTLNVEKKFKYIGRSKEINLKKSKVIMNRQI